MRLGGPVFAEFTGPDDWLAAVAAAGYRAVYCPARYGAEDDLADAYRKAAERAGLTIAEVGAWCNPLSQDQAERQRSLEHCKQQLALADRVGARCCVNISGSRGEQWDGPDPRNFTDETFEMIVASVREIIDAVQPTRTYYTLETMPWMYPDSADSYLGLLRAVDRSRFGVHLDPVNLICSPQRYWGSAALLRECFAKLGPHIRSCHAKDVVMQNGFIAHIDEVRPGTGELDYRVYLRELSRLDDDVPLMLEHLPTPEAYAQAAAYIRGIAQQIGVSLD